MELSIQENVESVAGTGLRLGQFRQDIATELMPFLKDFASGIRWLVTDANRLIPSGTRISTLVERQDIGCEARGKDGSCC